MKLVKREIGYVIFKCEDDYDYREMVKYMEPSRLSMKPTYVLEKILKEMRLGRFSMSISRAINLGLIEKL